MKTPTYKTKSAKASDIERKWHLVDATDQPVGRLASKVARLIRGKHKPNFTPHINCGDFVVVINADKVRMTGKKWTQKEYLRYSGYPGGKKHILAEDLKKKDAARIVERAVRGMIPKNRLGRQVFQNLFVYEGADHPHQAQQPEKLKI